MGAPALEGFSLMIFIKRKPSRFKLSVVLVGLVFCACSTKKVMEDNAPRFKDINEEYEKVVRVNSIPGAAAEAPIVKGRPLVSVKKEKPVKARLKEVQKSGAGKVESMKAKTERGVKANHEPDIEDSEGFFGRRPNVDPFRENEKVVLAVNYFNVEAGDLTLMVQPFKSVNEKKAYHFSMNVKSNKMFSLFYAVDDTAETFVDFDSLVPMTHSLAGRETAQRKEIRTYFDWSKREATFWEKTISAKENEEEKKRKVVWTLEPYAQNVISALFYLRTFTLTPGKRLAFRVADDGKNYVFNGEVLRREKLRTEIGEYDAVVVRPTFQLDGQFKPTGEILIWLTDDDRKLPIRIESKIKIGTLVAKLKAIQRL